MNVLTRTIAIVAGAALAAALAFAQDADPIRVNVRLINISFSVRDAKGNFVRDLTKDDFEVFDDGAPQKIAFFARASDIPLNLGIVSDMSGSQQHFVKQHEQDVKTFLKETLTRSDQAFVLGFGNHLRLISDFSGSPADLMDRLQQFSPRHKEYGDLPEIAAREIRTAGTAFYDAIYHAIGAKLAQVTNGRRALLIFSDGEDNSSAHHMLDAIEAAQRENVVLYGIRYTESRNGILTARNKYGTSVMSRLSLETGGSTFDAEAGDLKASFREIGDQLRSSYELAYHASQPLKDGTFHKVVVRAKRDDLTIRTKSGYYAREGADAESPAESSVISQPASKSKKRKRR